MRLKIFMAFGVLTAILTLGVVSANAEMGGMPGFAGSDSCRECHPSVYAQWRLTPHARMLVDAKRDPFSILADDFNDGIPFSPEDIDYTVGNHWVQKYLTRIDGILYVLPKYWNVPKRAWEPYSIWNWRQNPYNIHCDGCHTVGFDPETLSFLEPGIGCESCHGPGEKHVQTGGRLSEIVNPANLDEDRAQMICMQCHTDGMDTRRDLMVEELIKDTKKELKAQGLSKKEFKKALRKVKKEARAVAAERYPVEFKFPVGFLPGDDLNDYFTEFFMPKPKSKKWYWGSMDLLERKRMYYFFQSKFYSTNRACEVCGFDRGAGAGGEKHVERYMTRSEYCGTCHKQRYENFLEHSGHRPTNTLCTDCHIPAMAKTGQSYSVHDHKFDFSQPPPACTECHDETNPRDSGVEMIDEETGVTIWKPEPEHHTFHIEEVKYPREMTTEEACILCHKEETVTWARERLPELVDRFIVQ